MIVGARYKANEYQKKSGDYGYEFARVMEVFKVRYKKPKKPFIKIFFYDLEKKKSCLQKDIVMLTVAEFHEVFEMSYDLIGIDGIEETGA